LPWETAWIKALLATAGFWHSWVKSDRIESSSLRMLRKSRGIPMTRLVDQLLREALKDSPHWGMMEDPAEHNQPSAQEQS